MAFDIGELLGTISITDNASGQVEEVADTIGLAGESLGAIAGLASIATTALVGATGALVLLGQRGGEVVTMRDSFANLTATVGETANAMLGSMTSATRGLVDDMTLMEATNKAVLLGLPVTASSMGTLAQAATVLGRAMGQDAGKSLDDLTTALGRSSPLILDNLGLTVKVGEANETYARVLGKSADKLTEAEKKTAFYNAAMAAAEAKVAALGGIQLTFADRVQQARVMVTNFVDSLGAAVATSPVVAAGMDAIMESLQGAFGGNQQDMIKTIMGYVNDFAIGLTYAAQVGVHGAGILVQAWYGLKTVLLGVVTGVSGLVQQMAESVATAAEWAAQVPGATQGMKDFATGARDMADGMRGATQSLAEQTREAAAGAMGHSELGERLESVSGAIINIRDRMVEARDSTAVMAESARAAVAPVAEVGNQAELTAEQIKKMEEQTRLAQEYMVQSWNDALAVQVEVQNQIAVLQSSGIEQRLLELELARQEEIAGIQHLAFEYPAQYDVLVAAISEKYRLMGQAARGFHDDVVAQARAAGYRTQEELNATANLAIDTYNRMRESNKFTAEEMRKAWEDMEKAKQAATGATSTFTLTSIGQMLAGMGQALEAFGVRNKALLLSGAIMQGVAAIQKAWNSAIFPANLPAVAIVTAATVANVARISSSGPGYAQGTPDTRFVDFGKATTVDLHGPEAVVNRPQAEGVASMVEDELKARDTKIEALTEEMRGLRADMATDRRLRRVELRDTVLLGLV